MLRRAIKTLKADFILFFSRRKSAPGTQSKGMAKLRSTQTKEIKKWPFCPFFFLCCFKCATAVVFFYIGVAPNVGEGRLEMIYPMGEHWFSKLERWECTLCVGICALLSNSGNESLNSLQIRAYWNGQSRLDWAVINSVDGSKQAMKQFFQVIHVIKIKTQTLPTTLKLPVQISVDKWKILNVSSIYVSWRRLKVDISVILCKL